MLELVNIKKDYVSGENTVHALKGINLKFRESDLVSVLGPSGCGKTTMLNVIGGLDGYDDGDLIINGVSTKDYTERDWDSYRNHTIGFIFQSYNLISHQTVLENVELALTLSGVNKTERRYRAIDALKKVGLGDQLNKRPNQMSGGQMQRVAIARAIVNNPDIILADEPTGALDSETSVQVMDILREIAKERLVIMVTHNAELAEHYSTRIISMLDGEIVGDTRPLSAKEANECRNEATAKNEKEKGRKKPSMSFAMSFMLSLRNLFTKFRRTLLTSFAGSIGIIGIALIFAVSNGMTTYIDVLQQDTLSSYPIAITETHADMTSFINNFLKDATSVTKHDKDKVYEQQVLYNLAKSMSKIDVSQNDLRAFKKFVQKKMATDEEFSKSVSGVRYGYNLKISAYAKYTDTVSKESKIVESDLNSLLKKKIQEKTGGVTTSSMLNMLASTGYNVSLWQEILPSNDGELISPLVKQQYETVTGRWPSAYNEVVVVLNQNNEINDLSLFALGLKDEDEIDRIIDAAISGNELAETEPMSWTYEEILNTKNLRVAFPYHFYDKDGDVYVSKKTKYGGDLRPIYSAALPIKVCGIVRQKGGSLTGMLTGAIAYTSALTEYALDEALNSEVVKYQQAHPEVDIVSGKKFKSNISDAEKLAEFEQQVLLLTDTEKKEALLKYKSVPSDEQVNEEVNKQLSLLGLIEDGTDEEKKEDLVKKLAPIAAGMGINMSMIQGFIDAMTYEEVMGYVKQLAADSVKQNYAQKVKEEFAGYTDAQAAEMFDNEVAAMDDAQKLEMYAIITDYSSSTYEKNLVKFGCFDKDEPVSVNFYAATFAAKDMIAKTISEYNATVDEAQSITYTDYVGLIMDTVTTIIDAITYVLIAFVAISLVVSSIMIGVITLISVQERTKEIGILRAIGASKRNVAGMFNAETIIIGLTAGLMGVIATFLLCIPINLILKALTGLSTLRAILPWHIAIILIAISTLLTLVAGIIPSKSAAKKDPVVALRTE